MTGPDELLETLLPDASPGPSDATAGRLRVHLQESQDDARDTPAPRDLTAGSYVLGRHEECDLALAGELQTLVSSRHALLRSAQGRWWLEDRNSTNGTFLDGTRLQMPTAIEHNQIVSLGPPGADGSLSLRLDFGAEAGERPGLEATLLEVDSGDRPNRRPGSGLFSRLKRGLLKLGEDRALRRRVDQLELERGERQQTLDRAVEALGRAAWKNPPPTDVGSAARATLLERDQQDAALAARLEECGARLTALRTEHADWLSAWQHDLEQLQTRAGQQDRATEEQQARLATTQRDVDERIAPRLQALEELSNSLLEWIRTQRVESGDDFQEALEKQADRLAKLAASTRKPVTGLRRALGERSIAHDNSQQALQQTREIADQLCRAHAEHATLLGQHDEDQAALLREIEQHQSRRARLHAEDSPRFQGLGAELLITPSPAVESLPETETAAACQQAITALESELTSLRRRLLGLNGPSGPNGPNGAA